MAADNDNVPRQAPSFGVFDREYGLSELLPIEDLKIIMDPLKELFYFEVLSDGGDSYFRLKNNINQDVDRWVRSFFRDNGSKILPAGFWQEHKVIFALRHEREIIGYLVAAVVDKKKPFNICFKYIGDMAAVALNRIIQLNYQVQMISGLQDQMVAESYAKLQDNAERLSRSERNYRRLSENIEQEVQRKTATIRTALMTMAQQEKMASVGQLAAGVAHEINNPMGFIFSNLNTLREYWRNLHDFFKAHRSLVKETDRPAVIDPETDWQALYQKFEIEYLLSDFEAIITESIAGAERIKKIVVDLKEFSKPGLNNAVSVDLNQMIQTVLNVSKTHIGDQVQLNCDFSPLPRINCIPQQINQAILNIFLNAIQSMEGKGRLDITTRAVNDQVIIMIRDVGCGIAPEDLPRIFNPFFTTREVGNGKGLGLTFAYDVIQKHHGTLTVESQVNQGSCFTICIPFV